jgi:isoquinoline 1-oxidoreductase subunit beta
MSSVEPPKISRRHLIKIGAAGALLYHFHLPMTQAESGVLAPNAFIRVTADTRVTLIMPQVEMGQGVYTSIAMILADELDADFATVTLEHAPPSDKLYGNPVFGIRVTGNSNSIRAFWKPLRQAGATARAMLIQAAAWHWKVDPAACRTSASYVFHDQSGRKRSAPDRSASGQKRRGAGWHRRGGYVGGPASAW